MAEPRQGGLEGIATPIQRAADLVIEKKDEAAVAKARHERAVRNHPELRELLAEVRRTAEAYAGARRLMDGRAARIEELTALEAAADDVVDEYEDAVANMIATALETKAPQTRVGDVLITVLREARCKFVGYRRPTVEG